VEFLRYLREKKLWKKNLLFENKVFYRKKNEKSFPGYCERVSSLEVKVVLNLKEWHFNIKGILKAFQYSLLHIYCFWQ